MSGHSNMIRVIVGLHTYNLDGFVHTKDALEQHAN